MFESVGKFHFKKDDLVVFDRGYNDYGLFLTYCNNGIYFVTRLKKNAKYKVVASHDVSKYKNISSDQIIRFDSSNAKKNCPVDLRRIRSRDPETGKWIVILTNNFSWSPVTVAAIYKERWQIEIFFKAMKQNLKIKSFFGTSKNAVSSQIWIALIAYLLLSFLKFKSQKGWTIYSLMSIISTLLFIKRDLLEWLNEPFAGRKSQIFGQPELDFG